MPSPEPSRPHQAAEGLDDLRERFLAALLEPDARLARGLVLEAADGGASVGRLYLDVLRPALHEVGRLWEQARIGVAQEHLATQISQSVLAQLSVRLGGDPQAGAGRRAIVSCSPGELHAIGGQMVADFLEADGWAVQTLGADVPPEALASLADSGGTDVVALSTALPAHLLAAGKACTLLRRLPSTPYIVVGGQAYAGDAQRARAVGADDLADDPEALVALLRTRFAADGRATC
ncbi:MAG TPA: cobalamin-dependent protein [Solirubrobacteraceae bacterium]|jgi:methanogenic corrinoid protein MtbC1